MGRSLAATAVMAVLIGRARQWQAGVAVVGVKGAAASPERASAAIAGPKWFSSPMCEVVWQNPAEWLPKQGFARNCPRYARGFRAPGSTSVRRRPTWHALVRHLGNAGRKDVYIEKPVCHNIAEGSALIAAAEVQKMCQVGAVPLEQGNHRVTVHERRRHW